MYIRLGIEEGIIGEDKVRDICEIFGDKLLPYFKQRKQYDEYYYKYPTDIEVNENCIQLFMNKGYTVTFRNNVMQIS